MPERRRYSLQDLFQRHERDLYASVARRVSATDAEDVVQDAYLHLLERGDLDSLREPRPYLFRTAHNRATDAWRRTHARPIEVGEPRQANGVPDPAPGPEAVADGWLRLRSFLTALDELPEPLRHALVLNKYEGLTHAEIAARLGVSTKTVRRYLTRAVEYCAARLEA